MALYHYFKPYTNSSLPDLRGLLSESMNPATVHSCNEAIKETIATSEDFLQKRSNCSPLVSHCSLFSRSQLKMKCGCGLCHY